MPDITSLMPPPPNPQPQNALSALTSNPLETISKLQQLQILMQQAPALGQRPAVDLQTAQLQLEAAARRTVAGELGTAISAIPRPTAEDVYNKIPLIARTYPGIPASIINSVGDVILKEPRGIAAGARILLSQGLTSPEALTRISGPPDAGGAATSMPLISAPGAMPVGNPPGFAERQVGGANTDVALADQLSRAAEGSQGRRGILGNLEDTLGRFTSGPGADWTKVAKAFVNRNVPLPAGWQFSPQSIASQEEFTKQALQLAQGQFQAIGGTGTDAKFASAFETNPHETLSQLGNRGIIRLLKGNEDALQAKNNAWLIASGTNPNLSYRQFSAGFNANFDPRSFQFKYLSPAERKAYFGGMDALDQQRFLHDLTYARKAGWISFDIGK